MDQAGQVTAPTELEISIFRTIAFFSVFSWPLTEFEVWKFLYQPPEGQTDFAHVLSVLDESIWLKARITRHGRHVGIGDVAAQTALRDARFRDALRKHRKLASVVAWMRHVPGLRGLAICNSLSWHATTEKSDIDLFIATAPGRTWTARLFAAFPLMISRRRPGESVDPVCLSFFATTARFNLSTLSHADDPYLLYWTATIAPIVGGAWYEEFIHRNTWVWQHLPNARPVTRAPFFRQRSKSLLSGLPLPLVELVARLLQMWRLPKLLKRRMNLDTSVIVRNDMLKFHDNDRRVEYATKWREILAAHGL